MIADWISAFSVIAALAGGSWGLYQYRANLKWQRLKYEHELELRLYSDPVLRLNTMFIDWQDRQIHLPEQYNSYADLKGNFAHSEDRLAVALAGKSYDESSGEFELKPEFRTPEYTIYVEVFDEFSAYLEQVRIMHQNGFVRPSNIPTLLYIVTRVKDRDYVREYLLNHGMEKALEFMDYVAKQSEYLEVGDRTSRAA